MQKDWKRSELSVYLKALEKEKIKPKDSRMKEKQKTKTRIFFKGNCENYHKTPQRTQNIKVGIKNKFHLRSQ